MKRVLLWCVLALPGVAMAVESLDPVTVLGSLNTEFGKRFKAADANGDGKLTAAETKDSIPWIYQHFDALDEHAKGYLTKDDLRLYALNQLLTLQRDFEQQFAAADENNDSRISRDEAERNLPLLTRYFDRIDTDKRGYVTRSDIQAYLFKRIRSALPKGLH